MNESYRYDLKLIHIESGEVIDRNDSGSMFDIILPKRGNWIAEYSYVDQFGLRSNIQTINFNIENTTLNMNLSQSTDTKTFELSLVSAEDNYGKTPVNYLIKAIHEGGSVYDYETLAFPFSLDLNIAGNWSVEVTAIDEFNVESGKFSQDVVSAIPSLPPIAHLTLYTGEEWNQVILDANWTYDIDGYIINLNYLLRHESGNIVELNTQELFSSIRLESEGLWEIELTVTDNEFLETKLSYSIVISENGGVSYADSEPPLPDESLNNSTLLGIDSDNDGVRDDVEIYINSYEGLSSLQNKSLKDYVKKMEQLYVSDPVELKNNKLKIINYNYCLMSKFDDEYSKYVGELSHKFFNTKSRLMAWARSEVNFAGTVLTLDKDESNYGRYCD